MTQGCFLGSEELWLCPSVLALLLLPGSSRLLALTFGVLWVTSEPSPGVQLLPVTGCRHHKNHLGCYWWAVCRCVVLTGRH